jgi:hypothetical protein
MQVDHFNGNYLAFNVFLVKAFAVLYFADAKGAYYFFFGFLSAAL